MGRIKSKLIKRTSRQLIENSPESFEESFEANKKALGKTLSSKKTRNKIAGYLVNLKRSSKKLIDETENDNAKN